jgi:amidase
LSELLYRPALELARMVREGEVTASELVDASLERIEAHDPEINAFTSVDADGARAAAAEIGPGDDRPFAGVPTAIKELAPLAGLPMTGGSELFGDFVPDYDSFVVRRMKEAGFVIVGKTNAPEFGILPVTEPRRFGPTRNPWNTARTPGGSSGGAAAAVAAGMVPVAHGSDGGGSIRIPAACCGLVGLKPARGRISRGPEQGDDFLVTDGALCRTAADSAAMLDLLEGYEPGDATWAPPPAEPFSSMAARPPDKLRVAMTTEPPLEDEVDPVSARAASDAAELLSSLGHEVEEVDAPWRGTDLLQTFTAVFGTHISLSIAHGAMVSGQEPSEELIEPLSWMIYNGVRDRSAVDYLAAKVQLQAVSRAIVGLWSNYDVMLTPALGQRPVEIGEIDSCSSEPWDDFRLSGRFTPFTALFNVTGQPGISVPLFDGEDGLPLGVQFVGPPAGEGLLLALAAQLEDASPWAERRPPLAAVTG